MRDLAPSPRTISDLRGLSETAELLQAHLRTRWVFASQAHTSSAGLRDDDPSVIVDESGALHAVFGIKDPEVVYLRPDGYIGLRSTSLDAQSLLRYLRLIYHRSVLDVQ